VFRGTITTWNSNIYSKAGNSTGLHVRCMVSGHAFNLTTSRMCGYSVHVPRYPHRAQRKLVS